MDAQEMTDVALFGAGRIGKIHAGNLVRQPGVVLRYVVDVNAAAAGELAARHGAAVGGAEQVFADRRVRAVVIGSSTDTHAELLQRAAAAGKAVFCEKPVDLSLARARECAAAEIGEPEMLVVTSRDPGAPPVEYIKVSGGIFKDMLIHDFDIFRWILGDEAASLYATGSCLTDPAIANAGDIDSTAVIIRTKKGRLAQINTSRRAAYGYDQRFEVLGSKGMLQAGNHTPTEVTAATAANVSRDKPEHFFLERYRVAYAAEIAHFFEALADGTPVRTTIDDGVKALELAEAATTSWREKRIVEL
jgi:myo-inositol 2-dehydrogenase/D-chiro-inositol 1-dehydrogenase